MWQDAGDGYVFTFDIHSYLNTHIVHVKPEKEDATNDASGKEPLQQYMTIFQ